MMFHDDGVDHVIVFFDIIGEAGKKVDAEIFFGAVFCLPSGPKPLKASYEKRYLATF